MSIKLSQNSRLKKATFLLVLALLLTLTGCRKSNEESTAGNDPRLELIGKYKLDVQEPSGLALSTDGSYLWTLSDNFSRIYKISLKGKLLDSIEVVGYDMEGICNYTDNGILYICERDREIVSLDSTFTEVTRHRLDLSGELNSGLEGITADPGQKRIFTVNEKYPTLLLELDSSFTVIKKRELKIARDLSGLDYNSTANELWLLSDEDKMLFRCDNEGNKLDSFSIDIRQSEGIAVDFSNSIIYIISDYSEYLYVYKFKEISNES